MIRATDSLVEVSDARDGAFRVRRIARMRPRETGVPVNGRRELAFGKRRVRDEAADAERDPLVATWADEIRRRRAAA